MGGLFGLGAFEGGLARVQSLGVEVGAVDGFAFAVSRRPYRL